MSDDIIQIDGVEYERVDKPLTKGRDGDLLIAVRLKRKQTGWVCENAGCGEGIRCLRVGNIRCWPDKPSQCPLENYQNSSWKPYYGSVSE